jgi:pimeloyl-ACP methyl ester carboxylesterase
MGSFHTAGRKVTLSGLPVREALMAEGGQPVRLDPNGDYVVEQMYVQYFLPEAPNGRPPLLFWHGGGMTGKAWETTPDGREGWLNFFIRQGWDCYLCDAVERGRSGQAPVPEVWREPPLSQTAADIWGRFRLGPGPSSYHPDPEHRQPYANGQFPPEAFEGLQRQMVPRWTHTDTAILAAHTELLDRVGPACVIAHSQAGVFGLRLAHALPSRIRALVGLEPASVPSLDETERRYDTPTLIVMGDNMAQDARWPHMRQRLWDFHTAHPVTRWMSLPDIGQHGNSHMLMMDANSLLIAAYVDTWLNQVQA